MAVGINVLESLTSGMYENPLFMFREYVQNGFDSILSAYNSGILRSLNEGQIEIRISEARGSKLISIRDNGIGVGSENIQILKDVGISSKDKKSNLGFRGIGRLGGIAYSDEMLFITTVKGSKEISKLKFNCREMREIYYTDESRILTVDGLLENVTSFSVEEDEGQFDEHYFEVILVGVKNESFFNEEKVSEYLSFVLPVKYQSSFLYANRLSDFVRQNQLDEIKTVRVGLEFQYHDESRNKYRDIQKLYRSYTIGKNDGSNVDIKDIAFKIFYSSKDENQVLGWLWYGLREKYESINANGNPERGIRIRKGNIQIGLSNRMQEFFREDRFHWYFVGELHVENDRIIPNARRDFFNDSDELKDLIDQLIVFNNGLIKLCQSASSIHAFLSKMDKYHADLDIYQQRSEVGWPSDENEKVHRRQLVENRSVLLKDHERLLKQLSKKNTNEIDIEDEPNTNSLALDVLVSATDFKEVEILPLKDSSAVKLISDDLNGFSEREKRIIELLIKGVDEALAGDDRKDQIINYLKGKISNANIAS